MYLGIDLGTSGVKAALVDDAQAVIGQGAAPLDVARPHPLWSEQDPEAWWRATLAALAALKASHPKELAAVRGIGLSGQMHGATLLDDNDAVLRPAILWNDGRSAAECAELERREPASRRITGNLAMPGFTAPKLLWVAGHEPDVFKRVAKVLLPKDYLRLRLTGEHVSEMSDAAGTLWLDVAGRAWSEAMLAATGLSRDHMPRLVEGSQPGGTLKPELAADWGMGAGVVVAGGAGDNAAGAVGVGTVAPGRAFLSLGTSGVYFVANAAFSPNPEQAVHAFCHCLPGTWHQMSVILSAASCLSWVMALTGAGSEAALVAEIEAAGDARASVAFLPYLAGERTPHNDPAAKGVFFGLTFDADRAALGSAVLEGVAFAFADGQDALLAAGAEIDTVSVIGGGARSRLWGRILATVLGRPLTYHAGGEIGPAYGAARLGRLAATGEDPLAVCTPPAVDHVVEPDQALAAAYGEKLARYRRLYRQLREEFARG
ncbi:xylulokinase [Shumkonia mesophila]|uniref:xylulokinase n=1 Tax=Shumkonia mesophila TaxID=2838854 RepID=UPI0029349688|nr:xylulokinase [Shumkonia mesophila]